MDQVPRGRRGVMNDARRRVERALAAIDAADELARAAEAALENPTDAATREALREAVRRYRALGP